jgi:hypothetical protein
MFEIRLGKVPDAQIMVRAKAQDRFHFCTNDVRCVGYPGEPGYEQKVKEQREYYRFAIH